MKRMMIGGFENAENRCDNYIEAFAKLGCEAFVSLSVEDLLYADGLILPGSSQDMNPKLWGAAVSYTHLDVYKRQDQAEGKGRLCQM